MGRRRFLITYAASTRFARSPFCSALPKRKLIEIIVKAMNDKESYVYLAGVSAMTAVTDCDIEFGMTVMSEAVGRGEIRSCNTAQLSEKSLLLSSEARIKFAEALSFSLRRRKADKDGQEAAGFFSMTEPLTTKVVDNVVLALAADVNDTGDPFAEKIKAKIATETHKYFTEGIYDSDDEEEEFDEESKGFRLKTSGPIYTSEEKELHVASGEG